MWCTAYKVAPDDGLIQSETCRTSNRKQSLITRILCVLLVHIRTVGWCTVHTTSNWLMRHIILRSCSFEAWKFVNSSNLSTNIPILCSHSHTACYVPNRRSYHVWIPTFCYRILRFLYVVLICDFFRRFTFSYLFRMFVLCLYFIIFLSFLPFLSFLLVY